MTRYIRVNDGVAIPGIELAPEMKKGYVFESEETRIIEQWTHVIGPDGTAHAARDIEPHSLPTEAEVLDHIMKHAVYNGNGTYSTFERRDDDKIDRIAALVAKIVTGQKVTLEDIGK
ncbi:hypothetical protein F406_gp073 [Agrobacterium phage 7-7-1]|uniref:Uncharacterized protein n=1 Tax=Agrobacterium phage 7-7-1 TaxID=1161931 RepID=J7F9E4_9CAUD|nr:hypothetical protein F406_gp073 [Agrobacterium phage 7-7-1]AFH19742.1 hypothetical protein 7-7-1_00044 [Agrobacterium phage 7-7-1]